MLRFTALFWNYTVSWICAAFLHSVDADINGFQSFFSPSVIASVSLVALLLFFPSTSCCAAYNRGSWRAFFGSVFAFAICLGTVLMLLGFGGNSVGAWFVGFAGSVAIFGLALVVASLPMVLFCGIRNKVSESPA